MSSTLPPGPPRPSIYHRLMPLMYGLIGATAAVLFSSLICGTPISPPARRSDCKPPRTNHSGARPAQPSAAAAASPTVPDAGGAALQARETATTESAPSGKTGGAATKSAKSAKSTKSAPIDKSAKSAKSAESAPAGKAGTPAGKAAATAPRTAEGRIKVAIAPCVRAKARSFRVAVRLHTDGKVRRVFVARDPGVNSTMIECINRQLAGIPLPLQRFGAGYVEWRVRQTDKEIALTLIRPKRHRPR